MNVLVERKGNRISISKTSWDANQHNLQVEGWSLVPDSVIEAEYEEINPENNSSEQETHEEAPKRKKKGKKEAEKDESSNDGDL